MTRSTLWLILAVLFLLLNAAGAVWALVHHEIIHAMTHALLALVAAPIVGRLAARRVSLGA